MNLGIALRKRVLSRRFSLDRAVQAATLILIALLAVQAARLLWAVVTPVGPVGDWQKATTRGPTNAAVSSQFDPFFRLSDQSGAIAVTSLSLTLYGVRMDQATGRGAAIIATPDGVQSSYAVGDQIMPGVTLKQVSADGVTITRDGSDEQIFLDQSVPAPIAAPSVSAASSSPDPFGGGGTSNLTSQIGFAPRLEGGRVTGVTINPEGSGEAFRAAGLQAGDVLLSVNGKSPHSIEESVIALSDLPPGGGLTLQIERAGKPLTINTKAGQ